MNARAPLIVVAGHICLDVIPEIPDQGKGMGQLLIPGNLCEVGPALLSTGGAVANTGLALHRLGFPVRLMGKVGDDLFGEAILRLVRNYGKGLADGMIVAPGEQSSYSIVINPPGLDRIFLHCPGANDTFMAEDIAPGSLDGAELFHFGYPPLMKSMYEGEGEELVRMLAAVKGKGLTVSLDMAKPDRDSFAGRTDWRSILARALPYVDLFLPSFEELLFMLRTDWYEEMMRKEGAIDLDRCLNGEILFELSDEILRMGAAVAGIKLGEHGLYVRTASDKHRILGMGACAPDEVMADSWRDREILVPCYRVDVAGTTGAGDCTIAGLLANFTLRLPIEEVLHGAVAVGACNVERKDALSGIIGWEAVRSRIAVGWPQHDIHPAFERWMERRPAGIWERAADTVMD